MKIAYLCRNCTLDNGHAWMAWELAQEASRLGHEVHLVARRLPGEAVKADKADKADNARKKIQYHKVFQLPKGFGKWRALSFAWSSSRAGRKLTPEGVVHGFGDSFEQDVVTIGNVDWNYSRRIPAREPSLSAVQIKSEALNPGKHRFVVLVSRQLKEDLAVLSPNMDSSRIRVIYPGVNLEKYQPSLRLKVRADLSKKFGIPDNAIWIAAATGGDFEKRNVAAIANALLKLQSSKPWVFVFGGAAPNTFAWPKEVAKRSYFLGPFKDLSNMLPACDLFVYPAWFDEFAMVCLEAMASGVPTIISGTTGASELIPKSLEDACVLSDPDNANELSSKIEYFLNDEQARRNVGAQLNKVAQSHSWRSVYKAYAELYSQISQSAKN